LNKYLFTVSKCLFNLKKYALRFTFFFSVCIIRYANYFLLFHYLTFVNLMRHDYIFLLILIPLDYKSRLRLKCLQRVWIPTPRVGARPRNSPPHRNSPPSTAPLLSATLPLDGTDRFLIVQRNRLIVTATSRRLDWATMCSSRSSSRVYA